MFFHDKNEKIVRRRMFFSGRVTGVGFRYRTKMAADQLGLSGWVRNTSDDCYVEMEVQGTEKQIGQLLASYRDSRWIDIDHVDVTNIPVQREDGFYVRY